MPSFRHGFSKEALESVVFVPKRTNLDTFVDKIRINNEIIMHFVQIALKLLCFMSS